MEALGVAERFGRIHINEDCGSEGKAVILHPEKITVIQDDHRNEYETYDDRGAAPDGSHAGSEG